MRVILFVFGLAIVFPRPLTLTAATSVAARPPVLGTWQLMGTAPPGFVRHRAQVGRVTFTLQHGRLQAVVVTGRHRYRAAAQYRARRHEVRLSVPTVTGVVRLDATLWKGNTRMLGTWYDARGDDGGLVLTRLTGAGH